MILTTTLLSNPGFSDIKMSSPKMTKVCEKYSNFILSNKPKEKSFEATYTETNVWSFRVINSTLQMSSTSKQECEDKVFMSFESTNAKQRIYSPKRKTFELYTIKSNQFILTTGYTFKLLTTTFLLQHQDTASGRDTEKACKI